MIARMAGTPRSVQPERHALRCAKLKSINRTMCRSSAPPQAVEEIVSWAQSQFEAEVMGRPDEAIRLTRLCMLVALEEEAAQRREGGFADVTTAGTSSTWSLSRLDGLAAEALSHFEAALAEGSLPQEGFSLPGSEGRPSQPEGPASTPEQQPADQGPIQDSGPACSASAAGSSEPLSSNSSSSAGSGSGSGGSNGASSPTGASLRPGLLQQVRRFPFLALASLNAVLYDRHGYKACNRYGEPSDSQLSSVLETGSGSSAALSLLYQEVSSRLGLPLHAQPLEGGRYLVLWPAAAEQQALLAVSGRRFLVDPYGAGALLALDEVCDLFGVTEQQLQPASKRELLAALLNDLLSCHWARAIGCSPKPAFMVALSLQTALASPSKVLQLDSGTLERATAAARKRLLLLPGALQPQLEYGLLLFFLGRYDDAWLELGIWAERVKALLEQAQPRPQQEGGAAQPQPQPQSGSCVRPSGAHAAGMAPLLQQQLPGGAPAGTSAAGAAAAGAVEAGVGAAAADVQLEESLDAAGYAGYAQEYERAVILLEKLRLELSVRDTVL